MNALKELQPERVFYHFEQISGIPRGSGNVKQIGSFLMDFAREKGLSCDMDASGNVVIRKEAAEGYEDCPAVILQGHMDMVCEKRPDKVHDFEKDGLSLQVKDGFIYADGTTLGGDYGIALAIGMAILEDRNIKAPALECLFTVDEEIGLLGAMELDPGLLKGRSMINLDSELEGILTVACAGGLTLVSHIPVKRTTAEGCLVRIRVEGLLGGHSGTEINKGRANANILMGRFLYRLSQEMEAALLSLTGGNKGNDIPRECCADILLDKENVQQAKALCEELTKSLRQEYANLDEGVRIGLSVEKEEAREEALTKVSQEKVIFYLMNAPYGVEKMSGTITGLVETSSNLGIIELGKDSFMGLESVRSSIMSGMAALGDRILYLTEFLGGECEKTEEYPAWEYREDSPLRELMKEIYVEMYGEEPKVEAVHAGLECGILSEKIPGLDMVSIGPNIKDIHTFEEHLDIASVERVYRYVLKVLERMKS